MLLLLCKVQFLQCCSSALVQASRYPHRRSVYLVPFYQSNWCFIATALCSRSPAALQHSKTVVRPAVFPQEKLGKKGRKKIDCSLMPAVKYPKQSTSSHHKAHKDTHPHFHPRQIQNIHFTLIVFERETPRRKLWICLLSGSSV